MVEANFLTAAKDFFREDTSEIVGAYFDGETIFLARQTETFETCEISADGSDFAQLAEKISDVCNGRGWKPYAVGFCLRESDAVIFRTEVPKIPEKEIPALVETWSRSQSGKGAVCSFAKLGDELWMETLPQTTFDEICAAFRKCKLNLAALSVMPADLLAKITPLERLNFIIAATKSSAPNFIRRRKSSLDAKKVSVATAAMFLVAALVTTAGTLADWFAAANEFDAANLALTEMRDDLSLKKFFDADIDELHRLNKFTADVTAAKTFNLLIDTGKIASGDVHLTTFRVDENSAQVNGLATNAEAVKSCLARVKKFVTQRAQLENSSARDDGEITFAIRADFIND